MNANAKYQGLIKDVDCSMKHYQQKRSISIPLMVALEAYRNRQINLLRCVCYLKFKNPEGWIRYDLLKELKDDLNISPRTFYNYLNNLLQLGWIGKYRRDYYVHGWNHVMKKAMKSEYFVTFKNYKIPIYVRSQLDELEMRMLACIIEVLNRKVNYYLITKFDLKNKSGISSLKLLMRPYDRQFLISDEADQCDFEAHFVDLKTQPYPMLSYDYLSKILNRTERQTISLVNKTVKANFIEKLKKNAVLKNWNMPNEYVSQIAPKKAIFKKNTNKNIK
jgi:predicted transcriptional regulator